MLMISYRSGDLFLDDAHALVNTVNTVGVMGKGIALAFKNHFPHNYELYRQACQHGALTIGKLLVVEDQSLLLGKRIIINLPTKAHWRNPSTCQFVADGMAALRRWLIDNAVPSLAMPAPGCGSGGLNWEKVKPIVHCHLHDLETDIRVYQPF